MDLTLCVRRYSTQAKMVDTGTGTLYIIGSFKRMTIDADFKVNVATLYYNRALFFVALAIVTSLHVHRISLSDLREL